MANRGWRALSLSESLPGFGEGGRDTQDLGEAEGRVGYPFPSPVSGRVAGIRKILASAQGRVGYTFHYSSFSIVSSLFAIRVLPYSPFAFFRPRAFSSQPAALGLLLRFLRRFELRLGEGEGMGGEIATVLPQVPPDPQYALERLPDHPGGEGFE